VKTTVFVENSRYDKIIEAFGGVGVQVTTPTELSLSVNSALDFRRPILVYEIMDPSAGTESGRIGRLNPQSIVIKKSLLSLETKSL
tara:strand:+ start:317 stop:574 length:258 start_codon:yes stop_codon:yes gene_type:complete